MPPTVHKSYLVYDRRGHCPVIERPKQPVKSVWSNGLAGIERGRLPCRCRCDRRVRSGLDSRLPPTVAASCDHRSTVLGQGECLYVRLLPARLLQEKGESQESEFPAHADGARPIPVPVLGQTRGMGEGETRAAYLLCREGDIHPANIAGEFPGQREM